jgi:hypothetical protein
MPRKFNGKFFDIENSFKKVFIPTKRAQKSTKKAPILKYLMSTKSTSIFNVREHQSSQHSAQIKNIKIGLLHVIFFCQHTKRKDHNINWIKIN